MITPPDNRKEALLMDEKDRARIKEETRIKNTETAKMAFKWIAIVIGILVIGVSGCTYAVFHSLFSHPFNPS